MSEQTAPSEINCPARKQLAGVFVGLSVLSIAIGIKVMMDLLGEATDAAVLGLLGFIGIAVIFVFAALACTGLTVNAEGVSVLKVIGEPRKWTWDQITSLVYCLPRSPDAVDAFWFATADGRKAGIPRACSYDVARFAKARNLEIKVVRGYQVNASDFLQGEDLEKAMSFLEGRMAGDGQKDADSKTPAQAGA